MVIGFSAASALAKNQIIRIVTYNIEADVNGTNAAPLAGLVTPSGSTNVLQGGVLEGIGEEIIGGDAAQPLDILALEETTSNTGTVAPIVAGLNAFYGIPNLYAMSPYQAFFTTGTGNGPNALVYNTTTVQLLASVPVDPAGGTGSLGTNSGELREVMRYEFAPANVTPAAANEFYIYVSHYKSSSSGVEANNQLERQKEATIIRNDEANNLPPNARVLYVGDYNLGGSGEQSYIIMLAASAPNGIAQGQGMDPFNAAGATNIDWTASSFLNFKSDSSTSLHYRDDFEVMTTNIYNGTPGGLTYMRGTYHTFGNNGTTSYKASVNSGSDTALNSDLTPGAPISASQLYQDLTTGSDHLPVVVDYSITIPDPLAGFSASPVTGTSPLTVTFSNSSINASNYSWNFGDGHTSTLVNPVNTYSNAGNYSVILNAVGQGETNTLIRSNYVTVTNLPPAVIKLAITQFSPGGFQLSMTNTNGIAITPAQQARIQIFAATNISVPFSNWMMLSNVTILTNGQVQINDTNTLIQRYYRVLETP